MACFQIAHFWPPKSPIGTARQIGHRHKGDILIGKLQAFQKYTVLGVFSFDKLADNSGEFFSGGVDFFDFLAFLTISALKPIYRRFPLIFIWNWGSRGGQKGHLLPRAFLGSREGLKPENTAVFLRLFRLGRKKTPQKSVTILPPFWASVAANSEVFWIFGGVDFLKIFAIFFEFFWWFYPPKTVIWAWKQRDLTPSRLNRFFSILAISRIKKGALFEGVHSKEPGYSHDFDLWPGLDLNSGPSKNREKIEKIADFDYLEPILRGSDFNEKLKKSGKKHSPGHFIDDFIWNRQKPEKRDPPEKNLRSLVFACFLCPGPSIFKGSVKTVKKTWEKAGSQRFGPQLWRESPPPDPAQIFLSRPPWVWTFSVFRLSNWRDFHRFGPLGIKKVWKRREKK